VSNCTAAAIRVCIAIAGLCLLISPAMAQEKYRQPPPEIMRILDAPPTPGVSLNPQRDLMVLIERESMPPVSELAKPMLRLAGSRINPQTNGPFTLARNTGLTLKNVADGKETKIDLPGAENSNIGGPHWTTDGRRFAFSVTRDNGIELWVCDATTAKATRLTEPVLNATMGGAFEWMPDDRRIMARLIPKGRGPAPTASPAPEGPIVQQSTGAAKAPVRTYQDLLQNPHDEAQFDHYFTSQLALIDSKSGQITKISQPRIYDTIDIAPSGRRVLVSYLIRPYSYLVPAGQFPEVVELWDDTGRVIREIAHHPLRDTIPIQGVQTGPRSFTWQNNASPPDEDVLFWAEALDGGDPKNKVPHRDRLMRLAAPFTGEPEQILKTEHRCSSASWLATQNLALVSEYDRDRRWRRTWMYDLAQVADPAYQPRLLWDLSVNDRYNDPGRPIVTLNERGRNVILVHDNTIYLSSGGATPEGDRPFLDRLNLDTLATQRLWQCRGETYESVVDVLEDDASRILTNFQTRTQPPNYFARDLAAGAGGQADQQLTHFPDPAPQLQGIHKELVTYARDDGVQLSATLYLPPNYRKDSGERLPLIVWAYPREFNDPATAGQVAGSPYTFTRLTGISHLFLLLQGYAIMDAATMPVVGDPETMNDTFIQQVVASAKACIDKASEMGVADPDRVGVGGHSYGAFMTANLLAHSDLFRAGVARSGAYNRTLTPFGFQSERRTLWEAPKSYIELSPFMVAHKINEPLLMIHGEMDNNSGTFPMQSERLYHAIKGNGGTARLVVLPYESHGYAARESVMHTLAEMIDWFDQHVKYAPPRQVPPTPAGGPAWVPAPGPAAPQNAPQ
jgi:dipeptidyl aminopeptidase/acylaminoacyl peptidase